MRYAISLLLVSCLGWTPERDPTLDAPRPEFFTLEATVIDQNIPRHIPVLFRIDLPAAFEHHDGEVRKERHWVAERRIEADRSWHRLTVELRNEREAFDCERPWKIESRLKELVECSARSSFMIKTRIAMPVDGDGETVAVCTLELPRYTPELRDQARSVCHSLQRL